MTIAGKAAHKFVFIPTLDDTITNVVDIEPAIRTTAARFEQKFPGVPYTVDVSFDESLKLVVVVSPTGPKALIQ